MFQYMEIGVAYRKNALTVSAHDDLASTFAMSGRRTSAAHPVVADASGADGAQTLVKGLAILRAFRAGDRYLGNSDIAARTGLTRPTVSRLAGTLVQLGYLRYSESLGKYALGTGLLVLAYPMLAGLTIRQIARPLMKSLADEIEGQVSMGMASDCEMVFIETSRSPRHRHTLPEVGATTSVLVSAMGRAYLAALAPADRAAMLARLHAEDPELAEAFDAKVAQACKDLIQFGFTRSLGDVRPELHACAVPLRTRIDGEVVVVNCSVPAYKLKRGQLEAGVGPQLVAVARQIDNAMGQSIYSRAA
jgi:DNA-binding IclR family transcriptional regulator